MKKYFMLSCLVFSLQVAAQTIHYNLKMPKPQNHYFEVEMVLTDFKEKEL